MPKAWKVLRMHSLPPEIRVSGVFFLKVSGENLQQKPEHADTRQAGRLTFYNLLGHLFQGFSYKEWQIPGYEAGFAGLVCCKIAGQAVDVYASQGSIQ